MNYVIITAAGKGTRANLNVPKQYYLVNNKPLIAYTIEKFEKCDSIDGIVVVLDYEHYLKADEYFSPFNFKKIKAFAIGGETNQLSIYSGMKIVASFARSDDILIVHDGVRCLVSDDVIKNNINVCKKYGNAVAAIPCNEAMLYTSDGQTSLKQIPRENIYKTQTPHSLYFDDAMELMKKAIENGITSSVALCTLLIESGRTVYFSKGSNSNFKITQPEDIKLFIGYLN